MIDWVLTHAPSTSAAVPLAPHVLEMVSTTGTDVTVRLHWHANHYEHTEVGYRARGADGPITWTRVGSFDPVQRQVTISVPGDDTYYEMYQRFVAVAGGSEITGPASDLYPAALILPAQALAFGGALSALLTTVTQHGISVDIDGSVVLDATGRAVVLPGSRILATNLDQSVPGRNGAMINPLRRGNHAFDNRMGFAENGGGVISDRYDSSLTATLPYTLQAGDVFILGKSSNVATNGRMITDKPRGGTCDDFLVVSCEASLPANPDHHVTPPPVLAPDQITRPSYTVDWAAKLAEIDASLDALEGGAPSFALVSRPSTSMILERVARNNPVVCMTDIDSAFGGYETFGARSAIDLNFFSSSYSRYVRQQFDAAMILLLDQAQLDENRIAILKWITRHGIDHAFPMIEDGWSNVWFNGGGHTQVSPFTGQIAAWAVGETAKAEGILDAYTSNVGEQSIVMTQELLDTCVEGHDSPIWPAFYRRRRVTSVQGDVITIENLVGDPYWMSGPNEAYVIVDLDGGTAWSATHFNTNSNTSYRSLRSRVPGHTLSVGDYICFRAP